VAVRFVHTADLHLGAPFEGLHKVDEDIGKLLQSAPFEAFDRIIQLCIDRQVDFLVVAGDVYDSRNPNLLARLHFRDGLKRLDEAGIQAFVTHGNHDPLSGWQARLDWPTNAHFFGSRVQSVAYNRDDREVCRVYGISFRAADTRDNLAQQFRRNDTAPLAIAVLHCNVGGDTGHEPYAPCTLSDLSEDFNYWALGHVHTRRELRGPGSAVVYPGNPQGLSPREVGEKGCYVVTLDEHAAELEFVATDAVRWVMTDVSISGLATLEELIKALEESIDGAQSDASGRPVLLRMALTGRGPLHNQLRQPSVIPDLLETLREEGKNRAPVVWVDSIDDRTRVDIDLQVRRRGQDFVGEFLRQADELKAEPSALMSKLDELLTSHRELSQLVEMSPESVEKWIEEAAALGADLLVQEAES